MMKDSTRRVFMLQLAAGGSAVAASQAMAQAALPRLDEKDPQAAALGYAADTTKVDAKKFAKHTKDQKCSNCQVYTGKPNEPAGPCPIFAGKAVTANGWCSAWVKKA
jgi:hypothetical protein